MPMHALSDRYSDRSETVHDHTIIMQVKHVLVMPAIM